MRQPKHNTLKHNEQTRLKTYNAKAAAEAECDSLNKEYRKELENA